MRKLLVSFTLLCVSMSALAQFAPGQLLTASALNAQLATKTNNAAAAITGGTITGVSSVNTTGSYQINGQPVVVDVMSFGNAQTCNGTNDDTAAFQAAVNSLGSAGGIVQIPPKTCVISQVNVPSHVWIRGSGKSATTINATGTIYNSPFAIEGVQGAQVVGVTLSDLSINENNLSSAIYVEWVDHFTVKNVAVSNAYTWAMSICVQDATVANVANTNIVIEDYDVTNLERTWEAVGLCNAQHVTMNRIHVNGGANAPGVGIYQNDDDVTISNSKFENLATGLYYSQSTNNITLTNDQFYNNGIAVQGANQSDNGPFGYTVVNNLRISDSYFTGNMIALQLGALGNATLDNLMFYKNTQNAIVFDKGNNSCPTSPTAPCGPIPNYPAQNVTMNNVIVADNNTSNTNYLIHPGILFQNVGGPMKLSMNNVQIYDDQPTPTQLNGIVFTGAYNWSDIRMNGGRDQVYNGGAPVLAINGATISDFVMSDVLDTNFSGYAPGVTLNDLQGRTFGTLPTCTAGMASGGQVLITDAATPITAVHQQVMAGSGTNKALVTCSPAGGWYSLTY